MGIFHQLEDYGINCHKENMFREKLIRIGIYSKFWEVLKRQHFLFGGTSE